jgi:DGQHR domain-containing protein
VWETGVAKKPAIVPSDGYHRFSVSLVRQGKNDFYTLTVPSDVLARTCTVTTRKENPITGFQRALDERRAEEIAQYIDQGGTIPSSIVLSAQPAAELKIVGRGKTLEFREEKGAFLILDGQHRVFGFLKARTPLRVPVVIYNGLSRQQESRLFIDINTKQRPVPAQLLIDIKRLADIEDAADGTLREIFDKFHTEQKSALAGLTSPFESARNKITRVTFRAAVKPLLELLPSKSPDDIYQILNAYLLAVVNLISQKVGDTVIGKPVVFRALLGIFPLMAQRVSDRFSSRYTAANFGEILTPLFANMPSSRLETPGANWVKLQDYFMKRTREKMTL